MVEMLKKFKTILTFIVLALLLFMVLSFVFGQFASSIRFSYFGVISFYFYACIAVILAMELILNELSLNGSYVYLLAIVLKVGFFLIIFNESAMAINDYVKLEKMVLIAPMFGFLTIEVLYLMKKMNE